MEIVTEMKMAEVVARFKALGRLVKGQDRDEVLLQPYVIGNDEVSLGKSLGENRVEHLRKMALAAGIPEEKTTKEAGFAERILEFTASDETRDRYGDKILVDGTMTMEDGTQKKYGKGWILGNFKRNPVFMAFHQYAPDSGGSPIAGIPLGIALETWTDTHYRRKRLRMSVLMDDGTSNPMSPLITNAYKNKLMRAVSVGFWPEKAFRPESDEERAVWGLGQNGLLFGQQELWENSAVSIPANPNALLENGATFWDPEQAKGYEKLAAECVDAAPEFAYQLRSALARGSRTIIVPRGAEVEEPGLEVDCRNARQHVRRCEACSKHVDKSALGATLITGEAVESTAEVVAREVVALEGRLRATLESLLGSITAKVAELTTLLEGVEVPTRSKAGSGASDGSDDSPDLYADLLSAFEETSAVFAPSKE